MNEDIENVFVNQNRISQARDIQNELKNSFYKGQLLQLNPAPPKVSGYNKKDKLYDQNEIKMKDICIQKPQVELKMRLLALLEEIKRVYPDQEIVIKIPGESVSCKLGDSEVYEDDRGRVVISIE